MDFQLNFTHNFTNFHSMTEEADNLVAKLIEEELTGGSGAPSIPSGHKQQQQQQQPQIPQQQQPPVNHVPPPLSSASFSTWLYRDPQGSVQGPFATHEMAQWYAQGYFSGGLLLRRECDSAFITLADMCKLYKRNPFLPHPDTAPPPPITVSNLLLMIQCGIWQIALEKFQEFNNLCVFLGGTS